MKNTIYFIAVIALLTACKQNVANRTKESIEFVDSNAIITKQKVQIKSVELPFNYNGKWVYVKDEKEYYKEGTNNDVDKGLIIKSIDKNNNKYNVEMTLSDGAAEIWFKGVFTKNENDQLEQKVKILEGEGEYPNIYVIIGFQNENEIKVKIQGFGDFGKENEIIYKRQN